MVDSVSGNAAISSLLRAQSAGTATNAGIAALKSDQKAQQAIVSQVQQSFEQFKAQTVTVASESGASSKASSSGVLPRGSLVDITV